MPFGMMVSEISDYSYSYSYSFGHIGRPEFCWIVYTKSGYS